MKGSAELASWGISYWTYQSHTSERDRKMSLINQPERNGTTVRPSFGNTKEKVNWKLSWLTGSAPDFWGRGPGFESGISHSDPDALQDQCRKSQGREGDLPLKKKSFFQRACFFQILFENTILVHINLEVEFLLQKIPGVFLFNFHNLSY